MNWVRHGGSTTSETKSSYCHVEVEFNSINWVRHGSSTTFGTGLKRIKNIHIKHILLYFSSATPTETRPSRLNMVTFCPEHPKWDQNPKFTSLNETKSILTPFPMRSSTPGPIQFDIRMFIVNLATRSSLSGGQEGENPGNEFTLIDYNEFELLLFKRPSLNDKGP